MTMLHHARTDARPRLRVRLALAATLITGYVSGSWNELHAQQLDAAVAREVDRVTPTIIQARHAIHQNPELGNLEVKTAAVIASHLRSLGIEVRTGVANTGVVGVLRG